MGEGVSMLLVEKFLSVGSWSTKHFINKLGWLSVSHEKYFLEQGEHSKREGESERHVGRFKCEDEGETHVRRSKREDEREIH